MDQQIIKRLTEIQFFFGPGGRMRAFLLISFIFHVLTVITFKNSFPLRWNMEEYRTYEVELLRPPVEDITIDDTPGARMEHLEGEVPTSPRERQKTISLDTKDIRYITYARLIKGEILRNWRYPPEAREQLIEGDLVVFFSLTRDGSMIGIDITRTSGFETLDKEVVRAITGAAPFPPFPGSITVTKLNIRANFDYRITSKK